jgi:hypothetical protein
MPLFLSGVSLFVKPADSFFKKTVLKGEKNSEKMGEAPSN